MFTAKINETISKKPNWQEFEYLKNKSNVFHPCLNLLCKNVYRAKIVWTSFFQNLYQEICLSPTNQSNVSLGHWLVAQQYL